MDLFGTIGFLLFMRNNMSHDDGGALLTVSSGMVGCVTDMLFLAMIIALLVKLKRAVVSR